MNKDNVNKQHMDDGIEWDNGEATYGHKLPEVKRKDEPETDPSEKAEENVNQHLKNKNLSQDEDIANRSRDENRGVGGNHL
ncbi:hypothetical protein [Pedobacter frigidisoli]|uniref:hypothetical protein n=1 Tax=Pedobacter frigidisoli TaxID=2530455 RepID=UPI002931A1B8|nr:hypothetical protein [Pedobacter frigidisoli]